MKRVLYALVAAFIITACSESKMVTITVSNGIALDRANEMVEVSMNEVSELLQLADEELVVVRNAEDIEVPYQVTSDGKLIFPADVSSNSEATYTIKVGIPVEVPVKACGRQYPERVDDIAWENDLVAFRTYGPALEKAKERAFGYDVWTKYNTTEPVVEARYAIELNPETLAKIDSLKKVDPAAAKELRDATSYHVDHGNGLDCYKVGPTLGGGTAALMPDGEIIYPYCYKEYEIIDNGPLRFAVRLVYNPITVRGNSNVVETRVISLDAGTYMNKAVVSYSGLTEAVPVVAGFVLHHPQGKGVMAANAAEGYITYVDPTDTPDVDNGEIFVGAAFPEALKEAKPIYFSAKEKKELRGDAADGHILGIADYEPGTDFVYYFGSAWSKADIKDVATWDKYVAEYAQKVRNPLQITVK